MKYTKPQAEVVEVAITRDIILSSIDYDFLPEFTLPTSNGQTINFYE